MYAIQTSFVGRTEKKPAKVVAKSGISKVSVEWNSDLSVLENHAAAARKLCDALGRKGDYIGGEFGECFYWTPMTTDLRFAVCEPAAQEPVEAPVEFSATTLAAEPESALPEPSTALPEPVKPARVRRAA